MTQRFEGQYNQAGMFAPLAGAQAALFRVLGGVQPDYRYVRGGDSHQPLGDEYQVRGEGGFGGNLGYLRPIGVADAPLVSIAGYFGTAPSDIQPGIDKPSPWLDPTGASTG
jgi:hypothetical protein